MDSFFIHQLINIWIVPTLEAILCHSPMGILICMYFCILYDIHIFVWLCFHSFGYNIPRSSSIVGSYSKPVCSFKTVSHYVVTTDLKLTALLQSLKCWDYKYVPLCPTLYLVFWKIIEVVFHSGYATSHLCQKSPTILQPLTLGINHFLYLLV